MKKILFISIAVILIISFTGCKDIAAGDISKNNYSGVQTSEVIIEDLASAEGTQVTTIGEYLRNLKHISNGSIDVSISDFVFTKGDSASSYDTYRLDSGIGSMLIFCNYSTEEIVKISHYPNVSNYDLSNIDDLNKIISYNVIIIYPFVSEKISSMDELYDYNIDMLSTVTDESPSGEAMVLGNKKIMLGLCNNAILFLGLSAVVIEEDDVSNNNSENVTNIEIDNFETITTPIPTTQPEPTKINNAEDLLLQGKNFEAALVYWEFGEVDKAIQVFDFSKMISSGCEFDVAVKSDGTVLASGENGSGQCNVSEWTDVIAVSAGIEHTLALKSDGTCVATGDNTYGQCNVSDWTDIIDIMVGGQYSIGYSIGLKSDGTIVYAGNGWLKECYKKLSDIKAISASKTAGDILLLKGDGEVEHVYYFDIRNDEPQNSVVLYQNGNYALINRKLEAGTNNIAISYGRDHYLVLKSNGTVIAFGGSENGPGKGYSTNVEKWNNVVAISAGFWNSIALFADGTTEAVGSNANDKSKPVWDWTNIIAISAGFDDTLGLKADGTVISTRSHRVDNWDLW